MSCSESPEGGDPRSISIPPLVLDALAAHRAEQENKAGAWGRLSRRGPDLLQPDGSLWKPSAFTSAYRDLLRRRGLDGPNFHALRHSHASQLLRDHTDLKTVQCRLGHKKASFTLEVYGHLLPGQDQEAARRTDTRMRNAMEEQKKQKVVAITPRPAKVG